MSERKKASSYETDIAWAESKLRKGKKVWCVRWKKDGLVACFTAEDIRGWNEFLGYPTSDFTVQGVAIAPQTNRVFFGPECAWPRGESVCPNCGQWQHEGNYGDCFNECIRRGFAPRKEA